MHKICRICVTRWPGILREHRGLRDLSEMGETLGMVAQSVPNWWAHNALTC
jgi:hypothetical protein